MQNCEFSMRKFQDLCVKFKSVQTRRIDCHSGAKWFRQVQPRWCCLFCSRPRGEPDSRWRREFTSHEWDGGSSSLKRNSTPHILVIITAAWEIWEEGAHGNSNPSTLESGEDYQADWIHENRGEVPTRPKSERKVSRIRECCSDPWVRAQSGLCFVRSSPIEEEKSGLEIRALL